VRNVSVGSLACEDVSVTARVSPGAGVVRRHHGSFRLGSADLSIWTNYAAIDRTTAYVEVKACGTGGYSRWAGARVAFQYRLTAPTAWRSVATVYANRSGLATKRIAAPTVRHWRAQVSGATSPQVAASAGVGGCAGSRRPPRRRGRPGPG
jgi:hypothetical protein